MQATTQTSTQQAKASLQSADTLRGDARDAMLTLHRQFPGWGKLSEADQQWHINAIDKLAEKIVRGAVKIVANRGFPHVEVIVSSKGKFGGGQLEMGMSASFSVENATKLSEHGVGPAILVLAEPGEFFGERRIARAEPDQPDLPIDETDEEEGDEETLDATGEAPADPDAPEAGTELPASERQFTKESGEPAKRARRRSTIRENEPA